MLILSEAQRAALDRFFFAYQEQIAELMPDIDRIVDIAYGIGSLANRPQEYSEAVEAMHTGSEDVRRRVIQHEHGLFNMLVPLLSEEQIDRLVRVERWRDRARYAVGIDSLPGARLDIVRLVESLELDDDEAARAHPIVADYEGALVPLLKRRHHASHERYIHGMRHETAWAIDERAHDDMFVRERRRIFTPRVQLDTQLRSINKATLSALSQVLSTESSKRLVDLADATVYPSHYPDSEIDKARLVFSSALELDTLDTQQRQDIEFLREMFEFQFDRLRRLLDDEVFRFELTFQATLMLDSDDADDHDEMVNEIRTRRRELAQRSITTIIATLTVEQVEELGLSGQPNDSTAASQPAPPN